MSDASDDYMDIEDAYMQLTAEERELVNRIVRYLAYDYLTDGEDEAEEEDE